MKSVLAFLMGWTLAFVSLSDNLLGQIIALVATLGLGCTWVRCDLSERHAARQKAEQRE